MWTQRLQLAINVRDIEKAIAFYSKLFGAEVSKRQPGYANFAIENPPLKLVLFENADAPERLSHLGVEVAEQADLEEVSKRLKQSGLAQGEEKESTCCFATQDKVWSTDPDGMPWEWYRVLEDSETFFGEQAEPACRD